MSISISEFTIEELWGYQTFRIPIKDNKFVLVGENGTGKSTVANLIYFLLTRQWLKINEFDFKIISLVINGENLLIPKEDLNYALEFWKGYTSAYWKGYTSGIPRSLIYEKTRNIIMEHPNFSEDDIPQYLKDKNKLKSLIHDFKKPVSVTLVRNTLKMMEKEKPFSSNTDLKRVDSTIKKIVKEQILYLPTYRRIEQEFKEIFPELYEKKSSSRKTQKDYVELVEFGMEDVEQTINEKMDNLNDSIRNRLENLTGTYLSDVISKVYKQVNVEELKDLENQTIESIFSRIDEKIISEEEKKELRNMLEKVKNEGKIEEDQKVIAHFLLKLLKWHKEQQEQEKEIRNFVNICNKYLVNKEIRYDNIKVRIDIISKRPKTHSGKNDQKSDNETIELKMLSSGEKQIVSLFSHIYLSDKSDYFVIIDEPELSLSVPLQKRFLTDILNSGRCNGLIAVTHSPFIFDNELDSYTHSLSEFIDN